MRGRCGCRFLGLFSGAKTAASAYGMGVGSSCFLLSKEKRFASTARAVASGVGSQLRADYWRVEHGAARIWALTLIGGLTLTEVLDSIGIPGRDVRPAAQYLFFAWPKKRHQKKSHPNCLRPPLALREPAVLAPSGVPLELACGSDNRGPWST